MTPKEIKAIIRLMRSQGITHYKTPELELTLGERAPLPVALQQQQQPPQPPSIVRGGAPALPIEPGGSSVDGVDLSEKEHFEIKHKVEELSSVLKLSDEDLLSRLFPDQINYASDEQQEEEAAPV